MVCKILQLPVFNPKFILSVLQTSSIKIWKWRCQMECSGKIWWQTSLTCQACLPPLLPQSSERCRGRGDFQRWNLLHKTALLRYVPASCYLKMYVEKRVIFAECVLIFVLCSRERVWWGERQVHDNLEGEVAVLTHFPFSPFSRLLSPSWTSSWRWTGVWCPPTSL